MNRLDSDKAVNIISIAPSRFGGLDMLIPLFFALKNNNDINISQYFFSHKVYKDLEKDEFLYKTWTNVVDKKYIIRSRSLTYLIKFLLNIQIALLIVISSKTILLTDNKISSKKLKIFNFLLKLKGGYSLIHPSLLTIDNDYSKSVEGSKKIKFVTTNDEKNVIEIGYTKLYDIWENHIKNFTDNDEYFKSLKEEKIITIFLPSYVKGIFNKEELITWLEDVLSEISDKEPEAKILLKPHPMLNVNVISGTLKTFENLKIFVTYYNAGILSEAADFVITHHSSIIIDSMSLNTPTILHMIFTKQWLKRHPDGSKFLPLKPILTSTKDELGKAIVSVKFKTGVKKDMRKILNHKDNFEKILDG